MYVQIPANGFYFVLGALCGIVFTIWLFYVLAKKSEKKNVEDLKNMINQINQLSVDNKDDKKDK